MPIHKQSPCPMQHIFGEDEDAVEAPGLMRAAKQAIRAVCETAESPVSNRCRKGGRCIKPSRLLHSFSHSEPSRVVS